MIVLDLSFEVSLWQWSSEKASWVFVTVPAEESAALRALSPGAGRGFGSVRVAARVGGSHWKTSCFPDKKSGCYLLPVKKAVRTAERVAPGDVVAVTLSLEEG